MAPNSICQIDECCKRVVARGWCDVRAVAVVVRKAIMG